MKSRHSHSEETNTNDRDEKQHANINMLYRNRFWKTLPVPPHMQRSSLASSSSSSSCNLLPLCTPLLLKYTYLRLKRYKDMCCTYSASLLRVKLLRGAFTTLQWWWWLEVVVVCVAAEKQTTLTWCQTETYLSLSLSNNRTIYYIGRGVALFFLFELEGGLPKYIFMFYLFVMFPFYILHFVPFFCCFVLIIIVVVVVIYFSSIILCVCIFLFAYKLCWKWFFCNMCRRHIIYKHKRM